MSDRIRQIVLESHDEHVKYSHDCWGSTTSDTYYSLNTDKLATNLVKECLEVINEQIAISTIEQNVSLYELKHKLTKHFGAKF